MTNLEKLTHTTQKSKKRNKRAPGGSINPASLFGFFAFGGMAFIAFVKGSGANDLVATGIPVLIMLIYAALLKTFKRFELHAEQASDNFYYMGFLFTLSSLGVALYQFRDTQSASDIVRNFGIAIATTIAGIAMRIIWVQMRRDPIEIERESRVQLANASQQLAAELSASAREFSQFRSANLQMIQEGFAEVDGLAKIAALDTKKALDDLVHQSKQPLEQLTTDLKETLSKVSIQFATETGEKRVLLSQTNAELSDGVKDIRKHLKSLENGLAKFQTPDVAVKIEMEDALGKFQAMIEQQNSITLRLVEKLDRNNGEVQNLATDLKAIPTQLGAAVASMEDAFSKLNKISDIQLSKARSFHPSTEVGPVTENLSSEKTMDEKKSLVTPSRIWPFGSR